MPTFSEKVNAVSNVISTITPDPAERLGIVAALIEIYRHEIQKYFTPMATSNGQQANANAAQEVKTEEQPSA